MKRLILMRHAKSDWSGGGADHDRPLNGRGRKAASALGTWLRDHNLMPDQVLCSSAERTGETFLRLGMSDSAEVYFTRALYLATHHEILSLLHTATGDTVLVVGHNPGIGVTAAELVAAPPAHPKFEQYPSGATLVADFECATWADARWGNAIARHFVVPRDL